MSSVYVLAGWFGDIEWIEDIYANEQEAEDECDRLWISRTSEKGPDYATKLHKFAVEEHSLIGTASLSVAEAAAELRLRALGLPRRVRG